MLRELTFSNDQKAAVMEALDEIGIHSYVMNVSPNSCVIKADISVRNRDCLFRKIVAAEKSKMLKVPVLTRDDVLSSKSGLIPAQEAPYFEVAIL